MTEQPKRKKSKQPYTVRYWANLRSRMHPFFRSLNPLHRPHQGKKEMARRRRQMEKRGN